MAQANKAISDVMTRLWPLLILSAPIYMFLSLLRHCSGIVQTALTRTTAAFSAIFSFTVIIWMTIAILMFKVITLPVRVAYEAAITFLRSNVMITAFRRLGVFRSRPPPHTPQPPPLPTQTSISSSNPTTTPMVPAASVATSTPVDRSAEEAEEYDSFDVTSLQSRNSPSHLRLSPLLASTPLDRSLHARPESPPSHTPRRMPARTLDQFTIHPNEQGLRIGNEIITPPRAVGVVVRQQRPGVSTSLQQATRAQRSRAHILPMTPIPETTIVTVPVSDEETELLTSTGSGQSNFTSQDSATTVTVVESVVEEDYGSAGDNDNVDQDSTLSSGDSFHTGDTELDDPAAGPVSKPKTAVDEAGSEDVSDEETIEEDPVAWMRRQLPSGPCLCWTDPDTYRLVETSCNIHRGWYPERDVNIGTIIKVFKHLARTAGVRRRNLEIIHKALPKPCIMMFDEFGIAAYLPLVKGGTREPKRVSTFPLSRQHREILGQLQTAEYFTQSVKRGIRLPLSLTEAQKIAAVVEAGPIPNSVIDADEEQYGQPGATVARTTLSYATQWTAVLAGLAVAACQEPRVPAGKVPTAVEDPPPTALTKSQKRNAAHRAKAKKDREVVAAAIGSPEENPSQLQNDTSGSLPNPAEVVDQPQSSDGPETKSGAISKERLSPVTSQKVDEERLTRDDRRAESLDGSSKDQESPDLPTSPTSTDPPTTPSLHTPPVLRQSPNPLPSPPAPVSAAVSSTPALPASPDPDPEGRMLPMREATSKHRPSPRVRKLRSQHTSEPRTFSVPQQAPQGSHSHRARAHPALEQETKVILSKPSKPRKRSKASRSQSFPEPQQTPKVERPSEQQIQIEAKATPEAAIEKVAAEESLSEPVFRYPDVSPTYANVNKEQAKIPSPYTPTIGPLPYIPSDFTYPLIEDCCAVPTVIHRDRSASFNVTEARVRGMRWTGPSAFEWAKAVSGRRRATT